MTPGRHDRETRGFQWRVALKHYALSLALLAVPAALTGLFLGKKALAPIVSMAYLLAIAVAGWLFGLGPGLFVVGAALVTITVIATGGHRLVPQQLDFAAIAVLILVAVLSSRVAAYRNRLEKVLRAANEDLERRVQERTVQLESAREWFQITLASIGDAVIATAKDGTVTLMNAVAETLTGWSLAEAEGKPLSEVFRIVNEHTRLAVENPVAKVLREGVVVGLANHTILLARDGREIPIDDSAAPIRTPSGELAGVVLIFRDFSDRRRAEREREHLLSETAAARAEAEYERAHLQSLFMQAPIAIDVLRGHDHVYEFAHPLTRQRLGRDVTGIPVRDADSLAEQRGWIRILDDVYLSGNPYSGREMPMQDAAPRAQERWFDLSVTPWRGSGGAIGGSIVMGVDVTEQVLHKRAMRAAEERLRETAKLESLGVLAGGIAHDFNNLLVGILGNASLAQEMLPAGSSARELLADVVNASDKAATLTRQMLAYSGRGNFIVEPVDLSAAVREMLPLVSHSISPSVSIHLRLDPAMPVLEGDRGQIQQVVMNLLINAAEACAGLGGTVDVSTSVVWGDAQSLPPLFGLPPVGAGSFVQLEVRDSGCGMTDEVKAKVFDPFFTTKFAGRGLGLSAVLGIIRAHRGALQLESVPGRGTTFRVQFPAAAGKQPEAGESEPARVKLTGSGTILVIDDEEVVRKTTLLALQWLGYRVLTAENGQAGVSLFENASGEISLIILDLTMPVMDGDVALGHLKRIDPSVKVLLSSGFSMAEAAKRFEGRGLAGFLQKPYTANRLAEQVRAVLGMAERAGSA